MAKGNDGSAARRRTMRKLLTAVAIALVVTLVIVFNNGEHNQKDYPIHDQRRQKRRNLPGGHGSGGHEQLDDDVHSHKRGDESGDKDDDSTESGDDHDLDDDGGDGGSKRRWKAEYGLAAQYRKELIGRKNTENRAEVLEGILNGSVNLVDLEGVRPSSSSGSYVGVEGLFCKLDFALHKNDPSNRKYDRCLGATFRIPAHAHKQNDLVWPEQLVLSQYCMMHNSALPFTIATWN